MRTLLAITLFGLVGCVGAVRADSRAEATRRAAFDFSCPEKSIKLTPLTEETAQGATQYGAEGCGKRAVYVATPSGYVLNTATGSAVDTEQAGNSTDSPPPPPATASQGNTP
jgi:hypothetical protein